MTSCCRGTLSDTFDAARAADDRRRYHRRGPDWTTGRIIEELRRRSVSGERVLDVGGGIGVIAIELLGRGAAGATLVDASPAYLAAAAAEAEGRRVSARLRLVEGDMVSLADATDPAGLVALDRVICCYPDLEPLVRTSAEKCRRVYAVSYPRDHWGVRVVVAALNLLRRLRGDPFRTFVHPIAGLEELLETLGFRRVLRHRRPVWAVAVYERTLPA